LVVIDAAAIKLRFDALAPFLDERGRRVFAASEARAAGRGGATAVSQATGIARCTIGRGLADLHVGAQQFGARIRRVGGGGKPAIETGPGLLAALNDLVQSSIRGDPEAALLWVSKSQRHLAAALAEKGFTGEARNWSAGCCAVSASACRPTARRAKGPGRPIHMGGRLRQNAGRHQVRTPGRIASESAMPSAELCRTLSCEA
jgi:hypothetical protein